MESQYLNLPDLIFYSKCYQQYSINRGVYNTIDNWFYEYGILNVIYRRIYILAFLSFVKEESNELKPKKFIRFGSGGLTLKLTEFVTCYINRQEKGSPNIRTVK
jgi:hypothetical protein